MSNGFYVPWVQWDAEHRALKERIDAMEEAARGRRNRAWAIGLMAAAGVVCPLLVTALVAFLHLSS